MRPAWNESWPNPLYFTRFIVTKERPVINLYIVKISLAILDTYPTYPYNRLIKGPIQEESNLYY